MPDRNDRWEVHVSQVNVSARFHVAIFPIDEPMFLRLLPSRGWIVPKLERRGNMLTLDGNVTKGNVTLLMNHPARLLGADGDDIAQVIAAYREVMELAGQASDPDIINRVQFVEVRYIGLAKGHKSPITQFSKLWAGDEALRPFARMITDLLPTEGSLVPYGLRMAPANQDPNREDWTELTVVPTPGSGASWYHFDLIYRRSDPETVNSVLDNVDDAIVAVLNRLEHN